MTQRDDDAEFVEAICAAIGGIIIAARRGDQLAMAGEVSQLLAAIVALNAILAERPSDEALRRAVARL
jgi:hypothetical protein